MMDFIDLSLRIRSHLYGGAEINGFSCSFLAYVKNGSSERSIFSYNFLL